MMYELIFIGIVGLVAVGAMTVAKLCMVHNDLRRYRFETDRMLLTAGIRGDKNAQQ